MRWIGLMVIVALCGFILAPIAIQAGRAMGRQVKKLGRDVSGKRDLSDLSDTSKPDDSVVEIRPRQEGRDDSEDDPETRH